MTIWLSVVIASIIIVVHLVFCFLEKHKARKITKCFCIAAIAVIAWILGAKNIFVYFALFFGLLGDLCLIFKDNKKILILGMITFGINHILYYFGALYKINNLHFCFYFIIPLVFVLITLIIYFMGKKYFKDMSIPSSLYASSLGTETLVMIIFWIYSYKYFSYPLCFLPLIGNVIFISSDLYLAKTLFIKHDKREDFYIMLTYLAGQFLLALSIGLF
ncbi:MAG: lysoplasmalogenase family protein [Bacilli bacterium]